MQSIWTSWDILREIYLRQLCFLLQFLKDFFLLQLEADSSFDPFSDQIETMKG